MKKALVAVLVALMVTLTGTVPAQAAQPAPVAKTAQPTVIPFILGAAKVVGWAATAVGVADMAGQWIHGRHTPQQTENLARNGNARNIPTVIGGGQTRPGVRFRGGASALVNFGLVGIAGAASFFDWNIGGGDDLPAALPTPPTGGVPAYGWENGVTYFVTPWAGRNAQTNYEWYEGEIHHMGTISEVQEHPDGTLNFHGRFEAWTEDGMSINYGASVSPTVLAYCGTNPPWPRGGQWSATSQVFTLQPQALDVRETFHEAFDPVVVRRTYDGQYTVNCGSWYSGARLLAISFTNGQANTRVQFDADGGVYEVPIVDGGTGAKIVYWMPAQLQGDPGDGGEVEPQTPRHRLTTTIQCRNTAGNVVERTGSSEWFEASTDEAWESPSAPEVACPEGYWLDSGTPVIETDMGTDAGGQTIIEKTTIYEGGKVEQSDWGHRAGEKVAKGEEFEDAGVEYRTSSGEWVRCENAGNACHEWQLQEKTAPGTYRCSIGSEVVPLRACAALANWYNHTTPTLVPPVAPGDIPGGPDGKPRECFPNGWGMFNPLEWVLRPLQCAFIPSDGAIQDMWSVTQAEMMAKPPWSIAAGIGTLVPALADSFTVSANCSWQPDFGSGIVLPCDPERETGWAFTLLYRLAQVAIIGGAILLIARLIRSEMKKG